jgi:exoribonuclease-2
VSPSARPTPGALVDFFADGVIVAGVVLAEEKGRYRVVTEAGREDRIAPARVLAAYDGNPRLAPAAGARADAARVEAAHTLASAHARAAHERRGTLDLVLVWELLVDEGGERTLGELAELATGERTAAAQAAMLRALLEEKIHFARRADLWEPRSRALVEEGLRQKVREKRKAEERARFIAAARASLRNGATFAMSRDPEETRLLIALEETAVEGTAASAPAARDAVALIGELGVKAETVEEGAFRVLAALGIFAEDENLFVRRYRLATAFPEGAEESARAAIAAALGVAGVAGAGNGSDDAPRTMDRVPPPGLAAPIASGSRRDLTGLDVFTVDDALTSEIDDALSIEALDGSSWRVGVHIADPGFFVLPDSKMDVLAQARAVTLYLPDRRALMLPSPLSEDAASLVSDAARPTLSFLATVDAEGALAAWEIVPSVIRSRGRVTYEEADAAVRSAQEGATVPEPELPAGVAGQLRAIHAIALRLEAARVAAGAHVIRAPEVDLRVGMDGSIDIKRMEADDPGRVLVSEMMVLAGRIAAQFCLQQGVPCIYRRQPPAEEAVPSITGGPYDPVAVRKARRGLRRGEVGLTPGRHYALGLDAYAQATSPIRRYQDLVIHRQIKSALAGGPPVYDAAALQGIAALTDDAERVARLAERGSDEYWTLKLLEKQKGGTVEGVVVYRDRRRIEVELCETLYNVSIAPRPDHELGQRLRLLIESVNPRAASIHLRQLD